MTDVPASVHVLREKGPMDLRAITSATASRLGSRGMMYRDVEAVLESALKRGEVKIKHGSEDYREVIWEATT